MCIRDSPENKRKKQAQAMRDSLTVGDEITTIGGIIGTICAVKENTIVIETGADRVRIEFTTVSYTHLFIMFCIATASNSDRNCCTS